jgi:hypothetical protein
LRFNDGVPSAAAAGVLVEAAGAMSVIALSSLIVYKG